MGDYHYGSCAISLGHNWCTCAHVQDRRDAMHAPGETGLMGARALCGVEPAEGRSLWLTQVADDINCVVCKTLANQGI